MSSSLITLITSYFEKTHRFTGTKISISSTRSFSLIRSKMEFCVIGSTTMLNSVASFNPTRRFHTLLFTHSFFVPVKSSALRFYCKRPFNYPNHFSPFSRQINCPERPPFQSDSRRFAALAASSSAISAGVEEDRLPADIQVTDTEEPNSRVKLSVQVPPAVCHDCFKRVINEFMKQSKIPGFRPGKKVPESILIGYIGKQNVQKATIESILKRTLPHAMSSLAGRALRDSVRIVTRFSDMEKTYSSLNSLSYSTEHPLLWSLQGRGNPKYDVIVDVTPEIRWIPENGYKNLKIVVEIDSDIDAQKASEQELRRCHKSLGTMRIVIDRGLQVGDVAVLDISATKIDQDGSNVQTIPDAETKGFHFDTEDGDKVIPGFVDSLIGIKQGETKSFPLVFPDSWRQEHLRGVHAQFTVQCKELFYRELPDLNDSLAKELLPGCTTLEQVKETLLEKCQEVEQNARDQATDNAILDQLLKMVDVDIPKSLFDEQGRQLYGAKLLQIQANMKLSEEQLASLSSPKAVTEYLENQKENITNVIKQNLAVGDIFRRENLEFSTEKLVKEVGNSIAEFKRHKQEYDEDRVKEQVQEILEGAKVLEWLREHAEIQYVTR